MFITELYLQFKLFIVFQCPIALFPTHMHFLRENTAVKTNVDVMEHTLITVTIVAKKGTTWTAPRQRRAIPQVDVDLQFWFYINTTLNITICLIILCFFIDICCDGLHVQSDGRSADYKFPLLNITMTQDTFGYYYNGFYEDPKYYTRITSAVISGRYSQNIIHRDSLGRWMVCYIYS